MSEFPHLSFAAKNEAPQPCSGGYAPGISSGAVQRSSGKQVTHTCAQIGEIVKIK